MLSIVFTLEGRNQLQVHTARAHMVYEYQERNGSVNERQELTRHEDIRERTESSKNGKHPHGLRKPRKEFMH
jgi:hypothetical protein